MKTCRNCRALLESGSTSAEFRCTKGIPTISIDIGDSEYDQRLGKFVTIKPIGKCKKIRTNKELCEFQPKKLSYRDT